jgi:hypothetical protein
MKTTRTKKQTQAIVLTWTSPHLATGEPTRRCCLWAASGTQDDLDRATEHARAGGADGCPTAVRTFRSLRAAQSWMLAYRAGNA